VFIKLGTQVFQTILRNDIINKAGIQLIHGTNRGWKRVEQLTHNTTITIQCGGYLIKDGFFLRDGVCLKKGTVTIESAQKFRVIKDPTDDPRPNFLFLPVDTDGNPILTLVLYEDLYSTVKIRKREEFPKAYWRYIINPREIQDFGGILKTCSSKVLVKSGAVAEENYFIKIMGIGNDDAVKLKKGDGDTFCRFVIWELFDASQQQIVV
jgi:hypothetical protein